MDNLHRDHLMKSLEEPTHQLIDKAATREKALRKLVVEVREQERQRRQKERELLERFDMPAIEHNDLGRIKCILNLIDARTAIGKGNLVWLGSIGKRYWTLALRVAHHEILAEDLSADWHNTKGAWKAINACGHWRKAKRPRDGLAIVEEALKIATKDSKTHSALLTTGGGALRDLGRREDAEVFGKSAHLMTPMDFRPCTLLGAINIELGAYGKGAEWYEKAEKRGASRNLIDRELQSILKAVAPQERELIKKELKVFDKARYGRL